VLQCVAVPYCITGAHQLLTKAVAVRCNRCDRVWGHDSILVTRDRRDSNYNDNISGETLITIIRGQRNNISGQTATNHNHSEKIDAADKNVSQHKAYGAMHLGQNADEQKPDNEPTRNLGAV